MAVDGSFKEYLLEICLLEILNLLKFLHLTPVINKRCSSAWTFLILS